MQRSLIAATTLVMLATVSGSAQGPSYRVVPLWPQPLPNHWVLGSITGVAVDAQDHVWVTHRGADSLEGNEKGMMANPPTSTLCCVAAPFILELDPTGRVLSSFGGPGQDNKLNVTLLSFGFRNGIPPASDLVFDVRFLPNPNYVPQLKSKTGRDRAVRRFMASFPQTQEFVTRLLDLLLYLLPHYLREGKSYLTVAIGCTGGRHRSVALAEQIGQALSREGYRTKLTHRDIART